MAFLKAILSLGRDKNWLLSLIPKISKFLKSELGLDLHMGKLQISSSKIGVEFLGAFVRPYRKYVSNKTLRRTRYNLQRLNMEDREAVFRSINYFLGTLVHNKSFNIRRDLFFKEKYLGYGVFDEKNGLAFRAALVYRDDPAVRRDRLCAVCARDERYAAGDRVRRH